MTTTLARRALPLSTPTSKIIKSWQAADRRYDAEQARLLAEKGQIEKRLEGMKYPHPIEKIIKPIGEALLATMPGCEMRVLGPFGLSNQVSVWFYKKGTPDREQAIRSRSINFVYDCKAGVLVQDVTKDTKQFKPNTIGEMNGGNHPNVAIPADATLAWFRKYVRK